MTLTNDMTGQRTRRRLLEAAIPRLAQRGLTQGLLDEVIAATGCDPRRARLYFGRDEDLVMALYLRLAGELESCAAALPRGTMSERFHSVLLAKLALAEPYKDALGSLLATLLDPRHELGVLSDQTEIVRGRVQGVFAAAVAGASDRPASRAPILDRALYAAHLALLLLWTQDKSTEGAATRTALNVACDLLAFAGPVLPLLEALPGVDRADSVFQAFLAPEPDPEATTLSRDILRRLFRHRRLLPGAGACAENPCDACLALHLPRVRRAVMRGEPIHFLLPAFPAKSPSPEKVLGTLPDKAEELALRHLQAVCEEIGAIYPPGARLTICSDGRVFSDLVGVSDSDVTAYGLEIRGMLARLGLGALDTFGMEDLYETPDYAAMREQLAAHYAEPLEVLAERARDQGSQRALLNGIERFLWEERPPDGEGRSKSQIKRDCHERAAQVVQRSDAWGRLIGECFPLALRLSIHPQPAHSEKIGILLGDADDVWITPWHGVAARAGGRFTLMKRCEAEAKGGEIVAENGRPSFFVLPDAP